MIQDTSAMDQPIGSSRPLTKRLLGPGILVVALLVVVAFIVRAAAMVTVVRGEPELHVCDMRGAEADE